MASNQQFPSVPNLSFTDRSGQLTERVQKINPNTDRIYQSPKKVLKQAKSFGNQINQSYKFVNETMLLTDQEFIKKYQTNPFFQTKIKSFLEDFQRKIAFMQQASIRQLELKEQLFTKTLLSQKIRNASACKQIYHKWKHLITSSAKSI